MVLELVKVLSAAPSNAGAILCPSSIHVGGDGSVAIESDGAPLGNHDARFVPPEVSAGASADTRSMVFALGALLFEAVTAVAFESPEQVIQELDGSRKMAKAAGLGSEFWEISVLEAASKATDASPERRWSTPEELALEVERVARERIASRERLGQFVAEQLAIAGAMRRATPSKGISKARPPNASAGLKAPTHQTLLGVGPVGVGSVPASPPAAPSASHQTLIGVGPPSSERPLMLVKTRATAQAVQPAGASREPGSNLGGSSSSSSSLIAASDVPPDTGSAVTAYPEKKSRAGRVLLVLVVLIVVVAVPLEYFSGAVSRAAALVVPYLRARVSGEPAYSSTAPGSEGRPPAKSAARPPAPAEAPGSQIGEPALDAAATPSDPAGDACADCEEPDAGIEAEVDSEVTPAKPKALQPVPTPRRVPKRPAKDRDYGI